MEGIQVIGVSQFVKKADLCEYYQSIGSNPDFGKGIRNVSLYLMWGRKGRRLYCRIKCPISPLPIIGWWETPDIQAVKRLIESQGWLPRGMDEGEDFPLYLFNN